MHFVTNTLVTYLDEQFDRKVCEADHAHGAGHRHLWKCCHFSTQMYINCAIIHLNWNISNPNKASGPGNSWQESLTVKQPVFDFVIFTSEASRRISFCLFVIFTPLRQRQISFCHLDFWLRTSETAANMTARSRASAQVHIITELSNQTIHKIHKISSIQNVTSLTHLFPLTTVTGGLFKLEEKETSGVCTSVRSVHWLNTHSLLFDEINFWLFSKVNSCWRWTSVPA